MAVSLRSTLGKQNTAGPLWKGPEVDGITQSMLANWLVCRERFRIKYVEGWVEADRFNHRTGYGDMWHVCEEFHAAGKEWLLPLTEHCKGLCRRYPLQQEEVNKWYQVCKVQFPLYVDHWSRHQDVKDRTPLLQEQVFDVPYKLPSGRTVRLRGKWDSVDLIGKGKGAGIYLQENKTKGDIDEQQIKAQLTFDLQTMVYLVALIAYQTQPKQYRLGGEGLPRGSSILGVRYNVIRRPLSGGKGTIKQHEATKGSKCPKCNGEGKPPKSTMPGAFGGTCPKCGGQGRIGGKPAETDAEYFQRLSGIIKDSPDDFFMRWKVEVSPGDVARFRKECLDPILEQLFDWYYAVTFDKNCRRWAGLNAINYRMPYGVYSPLLDGGGTVYDEYLATGSTVGLVKADRLFKELS